MNTTTISNTTITFTNPITDTLGYDAFFETIELFRAKARSKGLTAAEHILYNKVRNLPLDRGFTPTTNAIKLANGHAPDSGFKFAKSHINHNMSYNMKKFKEQYNLSDELIAVINPL